MFETVLVANRGAIACRIFRTLRRMGIRSVAVYSEADIASRHVAMADAAVLIGPAAAATSYLHIPAILKAARETGAQAVHPGYGFLAENAEFVDACDATGLVFIGPAAQTMRDFGLKHKAREFAAALGVPVGAGVGLLGSVEAAIAAADSVGYPVMLKATAGGGGIGMRVCRSRSDVETGFQMIAGLGARNFADSGVMLERFVESARHIEVQVFGDGTGRAIALGERDCSLQRRNQKVIEETPAPHLSTREHDEIIEAALRIMRAARYRSAGTVEFLFDAARSQIFFLEVNTRLQVEHGVTEAVTGIDIVEWMVRLAAGETGVMECWSGRQQGAAIEARIYAEDPADEFRPSSGKLSQAEFPADARVDSWVRAGSEISPFYDPLLAKIIVTAPTREEAVGALQKALADTRLSGIETNLHWLQEISVSHAFVNGVAFTDTLSAFSYAPLTVSVLSGGPATTVQDYPGRLGYWAVGVPPSGPMDAVSFRLGNRLLGNPESAAGLEITASGPTLKFNAAARICLCGAKFSATIDGAPAPWFTPFFVEAGDVLKIDRIEGPGMRAYLLFEGGLDVAPYLDSLSTFTLGAFGGHGGRAIRAGDRLRLKRTPRTAIEPPPMGRAAVAPYLARGWSLRVLSGPHGRPDFFTADDIDMIASTQWTVHYNSNRTGVRLSGPKPRWARSDGGEAGLHPSNIHDNAYAIGALDFTGDMPILLGPDGPSLGGFVCPFVVASVDLWKLGQLAPGDKVSLAVIDDDEALSAQQRQNAAIAAASAAAYGEDVGSSSRVDAIPSPILTQLEAGPKRPRVVYRRQGDAYILVEYGEIVLDIELRVRVQALMLAVEALKWPGIVDLTPGIRSLQIHFDPGVLSRSRLLLELLATEERLDDLADFEIPSRIVHLPLSWDDPAVRETIAKYERSVRDDAPWCPDNIEFIRRVNGMGTREDVRQTVLDAVYLVLGLGDVYLGAPVATPIDPRHRLVTTKYNPARTWTPPNVVGIGGAYMCIYGMEGPGGYQLFGRTIQVWDTYGGNASFRDGKPWLLKFFDQIKFYPVSADELARWRVEFPAGRRSVSIEDGRFRLKDYRALLERNADAIVEFERRRRQAFEAERDSWRRNGEFSRPPDLEVASAESSAPQEVIAAEDTERIEAPLSGNVWRLNVKVGDAVAADEVVAVIEAMKMEWDVRSPRAGVISHLNIVHNQSIAAGALLMSVSTAKSTRV